MGLNLDSLFAPYTIKKYRIAIGKSIGNVFASCAPLPYSHKRSHFLHQFGK